MPLTISKGRNGILWIGCTGGVLARLDPQDVGREAITLFGEEEDLLGASVCSVLEDSSGFLWLSTDRGIARFDPVTKRFTVFDERDGLDLVSYNRGAGCRLRDGIMAFGGDHGLIFLRPDRLRMKTQIAPVYITSFKKYDKEAHLGIGLSFLRTVTLLPHETFFSFEFTSLDTRAPQKNQYAYKLDGFDKEWIQSGTRRYAAYTNLDPGEYIFRVQGSNSDGVCIEEGVSVVVIVDPPFWHTWWFRCGAAALFLAAIYGFYRFRLARVLDLERLRLRIADDLHDDIGSELSSIALESDILAKRVPAEASDRVRLQAVGHLIRQAAGNLRDVVWIVSPDQDKLDDLVTRIRDVANKMLNGIHHELKCTGVRGTVTLEMEFKRHVLMMFKELMNNIVKHAKATKVEIGLDIKDGVLRICVKENGIGFDPAAKSEGRGMKTLRSRIHEIGGELEVESSHGSGTTVCMMCRITRS